MKGGLGDGGRWVIGRPGNFMERYEFNPGSWLLLGEGEALSH